MALWGFTEISEALDCSPQNIYQKKLKLKKLGFIEIDEADGKEKINENGYNYLLNLRKNTLQNSNSNLNKTLNNTLNSSENADNSNDLNFKQDFIFDFMKKEMEDLKKRLQEEQEEKKYWQELYIKQSEDFKKLAFPPMLDTEEGNQKSEQNVKKGFFSRFFK